MIVCLGWGSLIWDPRDLALDGGWQPDGPQLPVEFARVSRDQRLTLVVTDGAAPLAVLWCRMAVDGLNGAIRCLAGRERCQQDAIGWWSHDAASAHKEAALIGEWAAPRDIAAVVWTALEPGFAGSGGEPLTVQQALSHLHGLAGERRSVAETYIRRAPGQIRTAYRAAIEQEFGWTPL